MLRCNQSEVQSQYSSRDDRDETLTCCPFVDVSVETVG